MIIDRIFKEHLEYLHQAILDGSNCQVVFSLDFIDCWF